MASVRTQVASEQFLMALGAMTLHWSLLEAAIDGLVAMVFHRFDGDKLERELPRMLNRKLKFIRKGFNRSPLLVDMRAELFALTDYIDALSETRHLLIHGSPTEYWTDKVIFTRLRIEPRMHHIETHTVSNERITALATEILRLAVPLSKFSQRLVEWIGREHSGEPNSERPA